MNEAADGSQGLDPDPPWGEKVQQLHDLLTERRLPYAFGGAIALNYHREPRSTLDIDINVFLSPEYEATVIETLGDLYELDAQQSSTALRRDGQARTLWGNTFVDLILTNTDFHVSMAERAEPRPFRDREIRVLSIEDLLVCKAIFDRPKDWLDIEAVGAVKAGDVELDYMIRWLGHFLGPDDERLTRVRGILQRRR